MIVLSVRYALDGGAIESIGRKGVANASVYKSDSQDTRRRKA